MDNNLDDFFNNKLNDLSSSSDGWDEPSASVWDNAQRHFPTYKKSNRHRALIWIILAGLGLFGTGYYLLQLKQQNADLQDKMAILNKELADKLAIEKSLNNQISQQNTTLKQQIKTLQQQINTDAVAAQQRLETIEHNRKITEKATEESAVYFQNIIQQQIQFIEQLEKENQQLKSAQIHRQEPQLAQKKEKDAEQLTAFPDYLSNDKSFAVKSQLPETYNFDIPIASQETWNKYEVGIDLATLGLNLALKNAVEDVNFQSNSTMVSADAYRTIEPVYSVLNAPSLGIHFGYGTKENFYVQTGIRYANFNINETYTSTLPYNDNSQYTNNQGVILNDLIVNSATPFSNIQQNMTVEIPTGTTLTSNDIVQSTLSTAQNYHFLQLPLGIAYYRGKRRLQLAFQGGITWNYILLNDYSFDVDFVASGTVLSVNRSNTIQTSTTTAYLGAYLGIGANYRLTDNWQIRTGVTFEESSLRVNASNLSNRFLLESSFNFSLNYRF